MKNRGGLPLFDQPEPTPPVLPDQTGATLWFSGELGLFIELPSLGSEHDLPLAPDESPFPARGTSFQTRKGGPLPRVPRLRHLVGPSVIALGMGLGAGEFLLWPNLITVNGYGIWWLFWVGVLTQFVVIHEIERWTIATGESVFAGFYPADSPFGTMTVSFTTP